MDIIQGLVQAGSTAGRPALRIVSNNRTFDVINSVTSNVIFSILNDGSVGAGSTIYTNLITNYADSSSGGSVSTGGTGSGGVSSQWTTVGTKIYYNLGNIGIGTLDPIAPLHIYNNTITAVLPTEIVVAGATSATISGTTDRVISFPYSGSASTKDYTFTTTENLICDILIVGGGGGGGDGGGGGGGYVYLNNLNIPVGSYSVKVGNGGAGGVAYTKGLQGASSLFIVGGTSYTAYGGGGGGGTGDIGPAHTTGQVGSYGGNGADNTTIQTYTSTQGNRGGSAITGYYGSGAGGGGAGGIGSNSVYVTGILANTGYTYTRGGQGGNGLPNSITGTEIYYAGGGTAGANTDTGTDTSTQTPPIGGGGIGSRAPNGNGGNGIDGTGGGGGGGDPQRTVTARGGSGIVIIRYRRQTQSSVSNARLLLDATTTGTASIEFRRGVGADAQNDFRIINDSNSSLKLQCENSAQPAQVFGNANADLAWFSSNETIIHKNTTMNGRVGVGTVYHATRTLDVVGDANVSGTVSMGNLNISSSNSMTITNTITSNTTLTIQNNTNNTPAPTITSSPSSTTTGITGAYTYQVFTYTTETAGTGTGQSLYTLNVGSGGIVCDILMVGGGGAGGIDIGAGGGGGAVLYGTNISIASGAYIIKVGDGAVAGEVRGKSTEGFGATILGGGCAGNATWEVNTTANSGGSGAGGKSKNVNMNTDNITAGTVGSSTKGTILTTATLYNGNVGGTGLQEVSSVNSAGGGGAGAVGGNGNTGTGVINSINVGGAGVLVNITGENYYWGGGGAGGCYKSNPSNGGIGGGGAGYNDTLYGGLITYGANGGNSWGTTPTGASITNGTPSSGGGGGGSPYRINTAGKGGSGIIIIKYLTLTPVSSSTATINLLRGTVADANHDYRVGNYNGEFKVISSVSNTDTDYIKISTSGAITNPTGTASWNTGSDRRIKENIERASYDKCFENINKLELNRFNYVSGFNTVNRDKTQLGFIAQEVNDIFPKAISSQEYYTNELCIPDLLSIDITQINYSLYGAVKKLIKINKDQETKFDTFDRRLKTIETALNIVTEPITSNIIVEPITSNITVETVEPITSNITVETVEPITSNIIVDHVEPITSNITVETIEPITSNITVETVEPITSNIIVETVEPITSNLATE